MDYQSKAYPLRLLGCVVLLGVVAVMLVRGLVSGSAVSDPNEIPAMTKPSVFYQLGSMFDWPAEGERQRYRDMWQGSYELDAIMADEERSSWASGRYEVAGPGVNPQAVGKLSDQELQLFRRQLKDRVGEAWQYAPADIRRKYERLYDAPTPQGLAR